MAACLREKEAGQVIEWALREQLEKENIEEVV